jgi:hypothetical protein
LQLSGNKKNGEQKGGVKGGSPWAASPFGGERGLPLKKNNSKMLTEGLPELNFIGPGCPSLFFKVFRKDENIQEAGNAFPTARISTPSDSDFTIQNFRLPWKMVLRTRPAERWYLIRDSREETHLHETEDHHH